MTQRERERWVVKSYRTKLMGAEMDDVAGVGMVRAVVSAFGNVDSYGDRVVKGAFKDTLQEWRGRGDPIPFIWSHKWGDPDAHVGWVPPDDAVETDQGLEVVARMDLTDPPAKKIYDLLAARRVTQFSFAFDVEEEVETDEETDRGWWGNVWELTKLKLYECGPCLLGANEETELLEVAARRLARGGKQGSALSVANRQLLANARDAIDLVLASDDEEKSAPKEEAGPIVEFEEFAASLTGP